MPRYPDLSGTSGIVRYKTGPGWIDIWFQDGQGYHYDDDKPGGDHVTAMQDLAAAGQGLATYISRHVRHNYARLL